MEQDHTEAAAWFRKGAEAGYGDAAFRLAFALYNGRGIPKDAIEAVKWYEVASSHGEAIAMYNLALIYGYGDGSDGAPVNKLRAIELFKQAIEHGHDHGVVYSAIAPFYARGDGVERDIREALKWYRKAMDKGDAGAANAAAWMLATAPDTDQDDWELAVRLAHKATGERVDYPLPLEAIGDRQIVPA